MSKKPKQAYPCALTCSIDRADGTTAEVEVFPSFTVWTLGGTCSAVAERVGDKYRTSLLLPDEFEGFRHPDEARAFALAIEEAAYLCEVLNA